MNQIFGQFFGSSSPSSHFDYAVSSKHSQFSFPNGKNSCTYCSLECNIYILLGVINLQVQDADSYRKYIDLICQKGASLNANVGFTSADEVMNFVPRFGKVLVAGNMWVGKVKSQSTFRQLLEKMKTTWILNSHDPNIKEGENIVSVVLTKPPETITVFYNGIQFVIFDSHSRYFMGKNYGAAFYFFNKLENCEMHLKELFPLILNPFLSREVEIEKSYNLWEATLIARKEDFENLIESKNKTGECVMIETQITSNKTPKPTNFEFNQKKEEEKKEKNEEKKESDELEQIKMRYKAKIRKYKEIIKDLNKKKKENEEKINEYEKNNKQNIEKIKDYEDIVRDFSSKFENIKKHNQDMSKMIQELVQENDKLKRKYK